MTFLKIFVLVIKVIIHVLKNQPRRYCKKPCKVSKVKLAKVRQSMEKYGKVWQSKAKYDKVEKVRKSDEK